MFVKGLPCRGDLAGGTGASPERASPKGPGKNSVEAGWFQKDGAILEAGLEGKHTARSTPFPRSGKAYTHAGRRPEIKLKEKHEERRRSITSKLEALSDMQLREEGYGREHLWEVSRGHEGLKESWKEP